MSHGNGSSQGKRQKKQLSNNEKIYGLSLFGVGEWVGGVVVLVG